MGWEESRWGEWGAKAFKTKHGEGFGLCFQAPWSDLDWFGHECHSKACCAYGKVAAYKMALHRWNKGWPSIKWHYTGGNKDWPSIKWHYTGSWCRFAFQTAAWGTSKQRQEASETFCFRRFPACSWEHLRKAVVLQFELPMLPNNELGRVKMGWVWCKSLQNEAWGGVWAMLPSTLKWFGLIWSWMPFYRLAVHTERLLPIKWHYTGGNKGWPSINGTTQDPAADSHFRMQREARQSSDRKLPKHFVFGGFRPAAGNIAEKR